MTAAQRLRAEGREEGLRPAQLLMLRVVQQRFGDQVDAYIEQRLRTVTVQQLEARGRCGS